MYSRVAGVWLTLFHPGLRVAGGPLWGLEEEDVWREGAYGGFLIRVGY